MLNTTTLELARLVENTDLIHLEHILELQVSNGFFFSFIMIYCIELYNAIVFHQMSKK